MSRPALLYVFADRVVPQPGVRDRLGGQPVVRTPSSGRPVLARKLDEWLLAWAFWELADAGAITLEMVAPDRGIEAGLAFAAAADPAVTGLGPLAESLCGAVPAKNTDLYLVIEAWATDRRPLPADGVTAHVTGELAAVGWAPAGQEAEWDGVLAAWSALDERRLTGLFTDCGMGLKRARSPEPCVP